MGRMALAAKEGGACAIRAQGMADIIEIKEVTGLPVFGIVKRDYEGSDIYITPTAKEVRELLAVGVEVIGLDMTARRRPHGEKMANLIALAHEGGAAVLADISTYEGGMAAVRLGADAVSTTLSGYTLYSPQLAGPDVALVRRLAADIPVPLFAEGRIHTAEGLRAIMAAGSYAPVIGSVITRPQLITAHFVRALEA